MRNVQTFLAQLNWNKVNVLAPLVLLILILMLCWKLASMFWWVVAPPQVIQAEPVRLGSQQTQVPNIASFALFAEEVQANDNLNIQLQGVVLGYPRHLSSAVLKLNDVADRYLVGEKIEGSAYELSDVYWDHVILKTASGATKEVKFQGIANLYEPTTLNNSTGSNTTSANQPPPATNQNSTNQNILGSAINQIEENREQYLKNMGVSAEGGQGYEVSEQTPAALRSKLGLRSGDRILSLNGQTVGQGQSEAQLLEQVKKEGKVRIEVKRGDQVMTFQQDL